MNAQEMLFNAMMKALNLDPVKTVEQIQALVATADSVNNRLIDIQNKQLVILSVLARINPDAYAEAMLPPQLKEETIQ